MGVSHLSQHSAAAAGNHHAPQGGSPVARQVRGPIANPRHNSAANDPRPQGAVNSVSRQALRPGNAPSKAESGGRLGRKSGQPVIGSKAGNKRVMGGGRLG